jgi:hypothetical protein
MDPNSRNSEAAPAAIATPGTCQQCGCTEERACREPIGGGQFIPCCWANAKRTLCSTCFHENAALARAAAGVEQIFEGLLSGGFIDPHDQTPEGKEKRAQLVAALMAAYIEGATDENELWQAVPVDGGSMGVDESLPRSIGLDIRQPSLMAFLANPKEESAIVLATEADLRDLTQ